MYSSRPAGQFSRLFAGRMNGQTSGLNGNLSNNLNSSLKSNLIGHLNESPLANGGHPSMSLLIRRTFKSPNVLHHKKGNNIPFYAAVQRTTRFLFPFILFLAYYNFEAPNAFLPGLFGFKQIRDKLEDEKDESVRKRKKVKRFMENDERSVVG